MLAGRKVWSIFLVLASWLFTARAQTTAPLPTHVVRSINPADTDFQDLEFLTQEIGPARVVMLGEPTHGEGNVFEAKIRLLCFLHQRMGFTTLAFESGLYDLHKAQQELEAGKSAQEALANSLFPIWSGVQEFQAALPLVGKGKLRVAGFDPQLSGEYGGDLVDDLQAFLAPEKGAVMLNYDYLDEVISFMGEQYSFLPTTRLADFEKEIAKAARLTEKAAGSPDGKRRAEAVFWQQCLRSLLAQAHDYAINEPSEKGEKNFKAVDSNPRDAQMADNLLWYLKQHPQEKVVCWGALGHFFNKADVLDNAEIRQYRPMGRAVKAALGADQVYILGTLAGSGTYGFNTPVPAPGAGSLEDDLLAQGHDYSFVSLKHDAPGRQLTASAFDYKPLTGPWSEVVDGFLFLRSVNPPHQVKLVVGTIATAAPVAVTAPSAMNPALRRASGTVQAGGQAGTIVRGVVLDQKTKTPVPYASVAVPGQTIGTVADGLGRFSLTMPRPGTLQVSSVGYATATVAPGKVGELLTILLAPSAYELQDVQVRGESLDPRKIMKKVLAALPANYEQQDYAAEVYSRRRVINFDTLRHDTEYVSQIFEPAGHRNWAGGFLMLGPGQTHRVQEVHVIKKPGQEGYTGIMEGGPGFFTSAADPVRISPLFKSSTLRKFRLRLDSVVERGTETLYVIGFEAKHANHRSTGTYLQSGYSGRVYVQKSDYAVLRYEALWEGDTATRNAVARKVYGKQNMTSRLYTSLFADARTDHVVSYARAANGHYYTRHSTAQGISVGRVLGGIPFHFQKYCDQYFTVLPAGTVAPPLNPKLDPHWAGSEIYQITNIKDYHPEFWETYKRPVPETSLPAAKP